VARDKRELSICVLRYVVGVVILIESVITAIHYQAVAAASHIGLRSEFVLILASAEAVAAILLLLPRTLKIGAIAMIVVFAVAAIVHLLHGQYDIGNLIIYAAATWALMANTTDWNCWKSPELEVGHRQFPDKESSNRKKFSGCEIWDAKYCRREQTRSRASSPAYRTAIVPYF